MPNFSRVAIPRLILQMLWAILAAMAVSGKELHTAEVAYAAIDAVDKLLFMSHVKVSVRGDGG
eukprot:scaffold166732_cov27-Tisochrysis_lutea.AAC.3